MNCFDCEIGYKLENCCSSHPETGKTKVIEIDGFNFLACPNLSIEGLCTCYDNRPRICSEYECPKLSETDVYELIISSI